MKQGKSGSMGNCQAQPVTRPAPAKVGPRGNGAKPMQVTRGGPRKQKSGSQGG